MVGVATAIPAFIGYTEKAVYEGKDLSGIPTRIESLQQFEALFGVAYPQKFKLIRPAKVRDPELAVVPPLLFFADPVTKVATAYALVPATSKLFYLYHSVRLFYINGGFACYILSIGSYTSPPSTPAAFEQALSLLMTESESTLVLCPDALRLPEPDYYAVVQNMLTHCSIVQSRMALLDVYGGALSAAQRVSDTIAAFRTGVGLDQLNYGIAYFPWVQTEVVAENMVSFLNLEPASLTLLKELLNPARSANARHQVAAVQQVIQSATKAAQTAQRLMNQARQLALQATKATAALAQANAQAAVAALAAEVLQSQGPATTVASEAKRAASEATVLATAAAARQAEEIAAAAYTQARQAARRAAQAAHTTTRALARANASAAAVSTGTVAMVPSLCRDNHPPGFAMENIFDQALLLQLDIVPELAAPGALAAKRTAIQHTLTARFPDYQKTMKALAGYLSTLPVAPALAGVYTETDKSHGVWKAPANVSLTGVKAPTVSLSEATWALLTVAAGSGKSINALRTTKGRGVLVWGARTLDGNSLDWRDVNVRRTVIMLEQSIKLALQAYVFEPNVATTWVTIQTVISTFLFNLWQQGALAGATTNDAYSVSVGLGTTMTADDILSGYLNVTVQVALTRPAEFILLTFRQQVQSS